MRSPLFPVGILFVTLLVVAVSDCAHSPKVRTVRAQESVRGTSSVRFVSDPENPAKNLPQDMQLHPPSPSTDLRVPEYPPRALAALAGAATVGVRFVVSVEGRVHDVTRSPLVPSTAGPFEDDFRAAAEATVGEWMFEPAWVAKFRDGPDHDGDGKPDYRIATSIERVPVYLDVRMDFEILKGRGRVRVSGLPEQR